MRQQHKFTLTYMAVPKYHNPWVYGPQRLVIWIDIYVANTRKEAFARWNTLLPNAKPTV